MIIKKFQKIQSFIDIVSLNLTANRKLEKRKLIELRGTWLFLKLKPKNTKKYSDLFNFYTTYDSYRRTHTFRLIQYEL